MKRQARISAAQFENGQVWQMDDSNVEIQLVGKRLVHYKLYKGETKRAPVSLAGKEALQKFLTANKGVLVQQ